MSGNERSEFEVRLRTKKVQRELDGLQKIDYQRVVARLRVLKGDPRPRGCENLYDDIYRVRIGNIRIIYFIDKVNKRIEVGRIHRRSEKTYKGIEELFR